METKKLITGTPQITDEDIKLLVKTVRSGVWVSGPMVHKFTEEFRKYIGSKYAVPVSSGTAALHLSLNCLNINKGDEIITTSFTYPATVDVIEYCGAKPVFVDIDKDTFNIDSKLIEKKVTHKTKAIIPVDIAGVPCKYDQILKISRKYNIHVVIDAAHSVESSFQKMKIGNFGDMTCFSFDVTKNVAGGMGGMITTDNANYYRIMKHRAHFGIDAVDYYEPYDTTYPGFKYDMTDFCAALAYGHLKRINKNHSVRKKYWNIYNHYFKNCNEIIMQKIPKNVISAYHLAMIAIDFAKVKCTRKNFIIELDKRNIRARIRFVPVHAQTYFKNKYRYPRNMLPETEWLGENVFCLPLSPVFSESEIIYVAKTVLELIHYFKNNG
jgi:dTDP-4-amino-4,6-dideoxygalactose transaminase